MSHNRTMIKVCGMTCSEDVDLAVEIGVDALGFILAKSERKVDLKTVKNITHNLPPFIDLVAVVVNPKRKEIEMIKNLPLKTIKAISIASAEDLKKIKKYQAAADYLLFDTKIGSQTGGTGE